MVVQLAAVSVLARQINESEAQEDGVSGARSADDDEHQSDGSRKTANRDQDDAREKHHSAEYRLDGCGVRALLVGQGPPRRACRYCSLGAALTCDKREPTCLKPLIATSTVGIHIVRWWRPSAAAAGWGERSLSLPVRESIRATGA